jgi:hypothetical protein
MTGKPVTVRGLSDAGNTLSKTFQDIFRGSTCPIRTSRQICPGRDIRRRSTNGSTSSRPSRRAHMMLGWVLLFIFVFGIFGAVATSGTMG